MAELELAVSVGMLCAAIGFAIGLAIGRGRQPRWAEKGSFVHKVSIGFATLDRLDAMVLRFEVESGSKLAGVEVDELRLPAGSGVALITRGKECLIPTGRTVLRTGDQVLPSGVMRTEVIRPSEPKPWATVSDWTSPS